MRDVFSTSVSLFMSVFQPVSREASLTFWPFLSDRKRKLIVVNDDLHGVLFFVYVYLGHPRRRQGVADELGRIFGPGYDIDLLPFQLLHHGLDPRPFYADAGAYGIYARVLAVHGYFRPFPGLPRRADHLDDPFLDLRHFYLEQLHEETGVGPRQKDRAAPLGLLHVEDIPFTLSLRLYTSFGITSLKERIASVFPRFTT